jgi:exonuclease III
VIRPPATRPHNRDRPGPPPDGARNPVRENPPSPTPGPISNPGNSLPKGKRANIVIATLNINGASAPTANATFMDKWSLINCTMRSNRIAILAIQETHLDDSRAESIRTCFGNCFELLYSSDPERPRSKAGVAFLINKALIPTNITKLHTLVPGRAITIKLKWHDTNNLTLTNIYAPIRKDRQPNFWAQVETTRRVKHLPRPDFLLGDFNIVEDAIDRAPAKHDDRVATDTLRDIRLSWEIQDQWRHTHPTENLYTYRYQKNGEMRLSRLDRIYSARKHAREIFDWRAGPPETPTDHWLISLKYAPKDAPLIGSGRWTWHLPALEEKHLIEVIIKKGKELEEKLDQLERAPADRETTNPQTLWDSFKTDLKTIAKKESDKSKHKAAQKIKNLESDRKETTQDPTFEQDADARAQEAYLANEIKHLMRKDAQGKREDMKANLVFQGEKLGGIWSAIAKGKKPRDLIRRLKIPNSEPPQYERSTTRMADLARNYHEHLQIDPTRTSDEVRSEQIRTALTAIPHTQLMEEPGRSPLDHSITEAAVENALKTAKNSTATGMDGCPYELWKKLNERYDKDKRSGSRSFNIIKTLTRVFQDIQTHGVDKKTNFTLGWMCPIYKKKDPTEISNYRPITLLDTDYKLLTKALALQLMIDLETLIHPDQAGFIPNRSIFNQIRLARTIIDYADITNEDGAIVSLDQEKAYDKIKHDYLWATLNKFNLPQTFIRTVKALYQNAHTQVAINGILSQPFQVTRGVRQGDPLSCALFDIAIEPLACKLRSDPNLKGFSIPGTNEKLITNLFADDTTLFLNKDDRMDDVQRILNEWCSASGAKFNIEKSEVIPLGSEQHRHRVVETRKINPRDALPTTPRRKNTNCK